jgi:hypothetical protein
LVVELAYTVDEFFSFKFTLRCQQPLFGGKFSTGVIDTGGKFAAGNVDTVGKFATGINNNNTSRTGGEICRRCR